jgi:hypothetical protein
MVTPMPVVGVIPDIKQSGIIVIEPTQNTKVITDGISRDSLRLIFIDDAIRLVRKFQYLKSK